MIPAVVIGTNPFANISKTDVTDIEDSWNDLEMADKNERGD